MRFAVLLLLVGCPGSGGKPPITGGSQQRPPIDAPAAVGDDPPSDAECTTLLGHAIELGMIDQKQTATPDHVPTDEEAAKVRADLDAVFRPECLKLSRPAYRCAITATTLEQMVACDSHD